MQCTPCNASCNAPSYKWAPPAGAALTDAAPSRASEAPGFWPAVYVGTLALSLAAEPLLKVLPPAIPPQPSPRSYHHHGRCSPLSSRRLRCSARTPGSASGAPSPRRAVGPSRFISRALRCGTASVVRRAHDAVKAHTIGCAARRTKARSHTAARFLCRRFFTAAVCCVPALRVPLVHSQ